MILNLELDLKFGFWNFNLRLIMNNKFKTILNNVLNHIADFYLYFLALYIVSLIFSLFFESWKLFFYWPAFHISILIFSVLSLMSEKGREFMKLKIYKVQKIKIQNFEIPNFELPKIEGPTFNFTFFTRTGLAFYDAARIAISILRIAIVLAMTILAEIFKALVNFFYNQIKKMKKADFAKIGLMGIILIFVLFKGADAVNFLILTYGLVSVLFVMESRISALIALAFLIFTPIFLIIGNAIFAEKMAVFAYYFLVIAVATQIREYIAENPNQELSTKF